MIEGEILQVLYDNRSLDNVNLLDYFLKKYQSPDRDLLKLVCDSLNNLENTKGFIKVTSQEYHSLGMNMMYTGIYDFEALKPHMHYESMTDGILARITFEGIQEVEKWKFQKQLEAVNDSVINTNKTTSSLSKTTLFVAAVAALVSLFSLVKDLYKSDTLQGAPLTKTDSILKMTGQRIDNLNQNLQKIDSSINVLKKTP